MTTLKDDLIRVIDMAAESVGHLPLSDQPEVRAWLELVRRRVQAGPEYDKLRRHIRVLEDALEVISDLAAGKIGGGEDEP